MFGNLKLGAVPTFVATKLQSNDQTVQRTDRPPMGCNIVFFQSQTQAQAVPVGGLQRDSVHRAHWLPVAQPAGLLCALAGGELLFFSRSGKRTEPSSRSATR